MVYIGVNGTYSFVTYVSPSIRTTSSNPFDRKSIKFIFLFLLYHNDILALIQTIVLF